MINSHPFCDQSPLWNLTLLVDSSWPQFTACFQSSVLVLVPNGFLWLALLLYVPWLLAASSGPHRGASRVMGARITLSLLLVLCALVAIVAETGRYGRDESYSTAHYVARFIEGVTYLLTALLTVLERGCGRVTSGLLSAYWLLLVLFDSVPLYSYFITDFASHDALRVVIFLVSYVVILAQVVLHAACADTPDSFQPGDCPETSATFLSRITFWWMTRLIVSGFRKPLEAGDLWRLRAEDESAALLPGLEGGLGRKKGSGTGTQLRKPQKRCGSVDHASGDATSSGRNNNHSGGEGSPDVSGESSPLLANAGESRSYEKYGLRGRKAQAEEGGRGGGGARNGPQFSLLRVLVRTYCGDVLLSYVCKFLSDVLQYVSPLLLGVLMTLISAPSPRWRVYCVAGGMLVVAWLQTLLYHQHFHAAMAVGMRVKAALMATVYNKALRLGPGGQRAGTVGEVVNMMSVDCQRVQDVMSYTWMVWSIPLQVLMAVYLLWSTLGVSVLAGVGLLVLLLPLNGYLALRQQALQRENLTLKDKRLKVMDEIISGIKVLKLYAWEASFQQRVLSLRDQEMRVLRQLARQNAVSVFVWTCAPYMVTLATFATYVLSDPDAHLDANKAFVTLALYNILQFPIAFLPEMISFTAQARVSIQRIEKFLKLGEIDPHDVSRTDVADSAIRIKRGVFTWDLLGRSTLHGVNVDVSDGELVAVVGSVGAGKSSLVAAILGEMERRQGTVVVKGSVAYVPQQAWIQNASVKDNILFGQDYDPKRYQKVLETCALTQDLQQLPGGDLTEIGEKGINLSGGQKQRVSLARAVYANADLYLLDDPLSALDSHVGKHVFRKVLGEKGLLRHKTRILVTHAVHWLPLVDTVLLMTEGRLVESGSYLQLMRRDGPLARYLHSVLLTSDDTDAEDDPEVAELRRRISEHVEYVTSASEGGASEGVASEGGAYDDVGLRRTSTRLQRSLRSPLPTPRDTEKESAPATRLTEEEEAATGRVQLKVFSSYISHVGGWASVLILVLFSGYQASSVGANVWLARWTEDPELTAAGNVSRAVVRDRNRGFLAYYSLFGVAQAIFISLYALLASLRMTRAAAKMHAAMLDSVLRSPMSFFDTTPSGRIVNRFARDVETLDNTLPQVVFMLVMCVFSVLSTLLVISVTTPLFVAAILPLAIGYYALQRFFVPSSRQLKRLEAVTRSPIFSHFSETLSGASLIRAFGATERFVQRTLQLIDKNQVFYFAGITTNRWLGVWVEVVSSCVVFGAAMFALFTPGISGGQAGLSITYALQITQALKWLVRAISDMETNIVSVERLQEFSELKPEAPRVVSLRPRVTWPSHGNIVFSGFSARYRPGLDLVVKNIDVNIRGGEKVGVVGRTGAGKSSLLLALFRLMTPASGTIIIDGLNTASLGLQDLRSRLTILPQDPVIFSGSLRMNLDPLGQFSERELWDSLSLAHLLPFMRELPGGLDHHCGEGGKNLSTGQRQLVCLARGLLRKTRILVLDEPTAAVDPDTDLLVQGTIRRDFADCTTVTIAHRLNTVMDYDRILVLEDGHVREFDTPNNLLNDKDSLFYSIALDAGLVA